MLEKLKAYKNHAYAVVTALLVAIMVPSSAFAASGLANAITEGITGTNGIIADLTSAVGVIVLIVLAVVGAKVVFSLLKKA